MNDVAPVKQPAVRRLSGFSLARQWRLTQKELAETLRDRRTIVTLVIMPVLVYPLLSIIFRQFLANSLSKPGQNIAIVGVEDEATREELSDLLIGGQEILAKVDAATSGIEPPLVEEPDLESVKFDVGPTEASLKAGRIDVAVTFLPAGKQTARHLRVELRYPERSITATSLRSFIERRLRAFDWQVQVANKQQRQPAITLVHEPLRATAAPRSLLPSIVPLVLLMMTITGAVYPAIDLTAGERERGTLEALIAAPVSRLGVLMAKYVAVLTVALLTAGMNLAAMSLTIYSTGLMGLLIGPGQNPLLLGLAVLGLLLLFACFFSALLLVVTSFAKSFKEAQAYLIPLMLVTLAPGLMGLSPTLELTLPLAVVPLVNVVLLARDVFAGTANLLTALVVVVSTLLYAAASIALAARIFGSDAILYGSGGSWSDLFRRPSKPSNSPSLVTAMFCVAIVFAAMINLGGASSLLVLDAGPAWQIITSGLMTLFVFAAIPTVAVIGENVRPSSAFRLATPSWRYWLAAIILGLSLGVLVSELTVLLLQWQVAFLSPELEETIKRKAAELNELPLPLIFVTLAIIPAIAEELFFRGYLFRAVARDSSPEPPGTGVPGYGGSATVLITAVLFAAFHAFGVTGVTLERLLPSLLMGLVLGTIALQSGSVWPGMILHALNNSLLLIVARYRDVLVEQGWLGKDSEHLPGLWLAIAAGMAVVGLVLLIRLRRAATD